MKRPAKKTTQNPDDSPLSTKELATLRPLREAFPDVADWAHKRRRARAGEEHKQAISIRLSPEVIAFYKTKGRGWQSRIDDTLRAIVAATK